ncbi:hypothetical protein KKG90_07240 [Candidatus Bipolaricaulota bacterium]|nr:hypothetical protein [Candidatus Bipolaricaulota bacterium]
MSIKRRIILGLIALCCVIGFSMLLIFNDPVRRVVLDPIIEGINAIRYVLGYVPQDLEWFVSLLVVFVVVLGIFASRLPQRARPEHVPFNPPFPSEGPTMRLTRILDNSTKNRFGRERVVLEMRDLAARAVAYHAGISVEEAKELLDTPTWTDDASVRDFLSLDKHRAGKNDQKRFHDQVEYALAHIERMYQEV